MSRVVSVLTPSRDYGRFIADALASVEAQPGVVVEHVIQDALSADETLRVLREAGERVRWLSEPDGGQSDGLNRALARARGDWIGWLNADEFYLPGALEALLDAADEADVVYGDVAFVDEHGRFVRLLPQHRFRLATLRTYGTFVPSATALIRRRLLGSEPWDSSLRSIMDWDLFLRLARAGAKFLHVKRPIAAFRVHDARVTAMPRSTFADEYDRVRRRHGLPGGHAARLTGRVAHAAQKATEGAYGRQRRARTVSGRDLRWFAGVEGQASFSLLMQLAYGRR